MERQCWCLPALLAVVLALPDAVMAALPATIDLALAPPTATLEGVYPGGNAGGSVCVADINGDSWPDIVVSSCAAEPLGGLRTGELTIVWGGYPGLSGIVPLSSNGMCHIFGPANGDPIYCRVASGDFNNDGFDDILWGHPGSPSNWSGQVFMIPGSSPFPDLIDLENPPAGVVAITGHQDTGFLGRGLGSADFNGDGVDDLIIAASGMTYAEVYVIAGGPTFLASYWTGANAPGMTRIMDVESLRFTGASVAAADFNGDGRDELVLGAPGNSFGAELDGRVTILYGAEGLGDSVLITNTSLHPKVIMPEFVMGQLGQSVTIGDVDSDGVLDIAVSAVTAGALGCSSCGAAYIIRNAVQLPDTLWLGSTTQGITRLFGTGLETRYGTRLTLADFDGDGRDDLAVSNRPALANQRARTVIAFANSLDSDTLMLASDPSFTKIIDVKIGDRLGASLAAADLDRDGLDDLLIGAPDADPPSAGNGGKVYLINGCYVPSAVDVPSAGSVMVRNFPNPFNKETRIEVDTGGTPGSVTLSIFSVRGEQIVQIPVPASEDSRFSVTWNGNDARGHSLPSGVYFCRVDAGSQAVARKMLLIR